MATVAHLGYPDALKGHFVIWPWLSESAEPMLEALSPLAHRLGSVGLLVVGLTSSYIAAMGRVLGAYTHSLSLRAFTKPASVDWQPLWGGLLVALPRLTVVHLSPSRKQAALDFQDSAFIAFAAACLVAQRRVKLHVPKLEVTEGEATGLANEWVSVLRV